MLSLKTSRWRLSELQAYEAECPCGFITSYPFHEAM